MLPPLEGEETKLGESLDVERPLSRMEEELESSLESSSGSEDEV